MSERLPVRLKRIYEPPSDDDGTRILVERLWPRGMSKPRAAVDLWPKEVAPSAELRKWYDHDVTRWDEFQERYRAELREKEELGAEGAEALLAVRDAIRDGPVTFVYAARDEEHNSALLLKAYLEQDWTD